MGENFCGTIFEKVKLEFCKAYVNMVRIYNCSNSSKLIPIRVKPDVEHDKNAHFMVGGWGPREI